LERRTPLLAQKALYWDETMPDMAGVFIIMTSGCVLGGDRLAFEIRAREGARAHVTTQAATKIHSMDANYAAQVQSIHVGADAYLEVMPEPIIPHRGSRFVTESEIVVDPSGTLFYSEILMSGRKHHRADESFGFDVFCSKVTASRPDHSALFTEKFIVQPRGRDVRQTGIMGSYEVFGNVLLLTPKPQADRILAETKAEVGRSIACGAMRLPNDAGVVFKALGMESHDVQKKIHEFWGAVREVIVGSKTNRDWFWK
jgi:urease accessory protein